MKNHLAHTPLKGQKLLEKLEGYEGAVGFDVEFVGPLLRGQNFTNISYAALLGFSLAFEDGEAWYVPFRHKGTNASFETGAKIIERLSELSVWAHNAKAEYHGLWMQDYDLPMIYDSMVLAWLAEKRNHGLSLEALGHKGLPYDPSISYRPAQEVLDYACQDARAPLDLAYQYKEHANKWFEEECKFVKVLAQCKWNGIRINYQLLRNVRDRAHREMEGILCGWEELSEGVSISSSKQLQDLYWDGTWCDKVKLTSSKQYSTNSATMKYQAEHAPTDAGRKLAQLRLDYQEVAKIIGTYTTGLIEEARQWRDGKLHPDLHHFGTVTGRLSSAHPNIQNQPAHGEWAKLVKEAYVPDHGFEFTSADYSQIELRLFAQYCGGALLQAFVDGKDLHQVTADAVGVSRQLGKTINFGFLLYGGGPRKMAGLLGVEEQEAKEVIEKLHAGYPEIETWRSKVIRTVTERERPWAMTMAGRRREFWELRPGDWEREDEGGYRQAAKAMAKKYGLTSKRRVDSALESRGRRLVVNYLIQGGARDLLVVGMNNFELSKPTSSWTTVTTVHDEVLIQHPAGSGKLARQILKESLEGAGEYFGLKVPIIAEPKTGRNWAEVK